MFDYSLVVQSAVNSFNNAALSAPTFFWTAVLSIPLFALVYYFGWDAIAKLKLKKIFVEKKFLTFDLSLVIEGVLMLWLIIMHGNYAVLRDEKSVLPFIIATILFILSASFAQKIRQIDIKMPEVINRIRYKKITLAIISLLVIAVIGLSGAPTWWGFLMQSAAVVCGFIAGFRWKRGISPIFITTIAIFALNSLILMQPEFFRFGMLGHLTVLHIISLFITGALAVSVLALRNVKPRAKMKKSTFVKLKWMARIIAILLAILFIVTESILIFLFMMIAVFTVFAISILHEKSIPESLSKKLWAVMLCSFGIVIMMPIITALGIMYWVSIPENNAMKQSKNLL